MSKWIGTGAMIIGRLDELLGTAAEVEHNT